MTSRIQQPINEFLNNGEVGSNKSDAFSEAALSVSACKQKNIA